MPFLTELRIKSVRGQDKYVVTHPLLYRSEKYGVTIRVETNFETNFASIPRSVKFWIDDNSKFIREASVIHDYLYSRVSRERYPLTRHDADCILVEAMEELGASKIKRMAVFTAVRLGGWLAWEKSNA